MKFDFRTSCNLDLLNFINVLTRSEFYVREHGSAAQRFEALLQPAFFDAVQEAADINGSPMLGPILSLIVSAAPHFERRSLTKLLASPDFLFEHFSTTPYYSAEKWPQQVSILGKIVPVIRELERLGFREYWRSERLPLVESVLQDLKRFAAQFRLEEEIENMLGRGQAPDRITAYLCTFAAPHGIKICGPRYIADVRFPRETVIGVAVHEMFHPPYNAGRLKEELQALGEDPLLAESFRSQNPDYAYRTMEGFIEENVVEAMAISICHRLNLEPDPMGYFARHDEGSHRFSVVLFDELRRRPKPADVPFEEYFRSLVRRLPLGALDQVYQRILETG
ncbi:MAG: hypothetical protein GX495_05255 [Chloroflexi bacterium]|jgi:hypothetical protein|nr:hypothetical protein [Chloroflexota bacterium]